MTVYLTKNDVLAIADEVPPAHHIRDAGQLHAAILRPQATAFGLDAYPALWEKAAALARSLIIGRPLKDGNALTANPSKYEDTHAAHTLVIAIATGELVDVPDIAARLRGLCGRSG